MQKNIPIESEQVVAKGYFKFCMLAKRGYNLIHHPGAIRAYNDLRGLEEECNPDFAITSPQGEISFILEVTRTPAEKLLSSQTKQKQMRILKAEHQRNPDVHPFLFPFEILIHLEWGFALLQSIADGRHNWDSARRLLRKSIQRNEYDFNNIGK